MNELKFLAVGDIVGTPGVEFIKSHLWNLRRLDGIDCVIANGENAAAGNGIDSKTADILFESGVDVITTGNHVWQKHDIYQYIDDHKNIIRPANYPPECPGHGYTTIDVCGYKVLVVNILGCVFMEWGMESPFPVIDRILTREEGKFDFGIVDIHAEATSEKIAFAKYLDLKKSPVSMVFGTHTHVQTADAKVLRNGTGYITDVGMTGADDSVLGIKNDLVIKKFVTKMPVRFETETENVSMEYIKFDINVPKFDVSLVKSYKIY